MTFRARLTSRDDSRVRLDNVRKDKVPALKGQGAQLTIRGELIDEKVAILVAAVQPRDLRRAKGAREASAA